jgi:UDP-N-acetylmuramate--alanine ligase
MLGRTRRIHFVGIGGIGMSGIAELLVNLGYSVTGSDVRRSDVTDRLAGLGVRVAEGHRAEQVEDADVVVVSSAVRPDNVEVREAARRHIPVIPRAEMLAELMRLRQGIAVAGAHGKTSTTSMIALVLERAGLDPTAVIGGRVSAFGSNARLGRGDLMVAEADESDRSFLRLSPTLAVITNIDREHLEAYGSFEALGQAFVDFANKVPFYGAVVLSADDPELRRLAPRITRRVVSYSIAGQPADLTGDRCRFEPFASACRVALRRRDGGSEPLGEVRLGVPGRHNLSNALAAVGVGLELDVPFVRIAEALGGFRGAERRFQLAGEADDVMVVDDYGHHPTEVAAVVDAAQTSLGRRLVLVFQPHRYSRTAALVNEFGHALAAADEVLILPIYGAGEDPIPGVDASLIVRAAAREARARVHAVRSLDEVPGLVAAITRHGDLVITLGAGSVGTLAPRILQALADRAAASGGTR